MSDDADNEWRVERAARDLLERYGEDAARIVGEYAETAAATRDELSAKAWCDIAKVIDRLTRESANQD
jgi:hypothetical protein